MRQFNITVNGVQYSVAVEEVGAASAPVAAPGPLSCARFPSLGTQSSSSLVFSHSCCLLTSAGSTLKANLQGLGTP